MEEQNKQMKQKKRIFISAYRNFSIRYLLYSGVLKRLEEKGFEISIFLCEADLDYYQKKLASPQTKLHPILFKETLHLLKTHPLSRLFVLIRKCLKASKKGEVNTTDNVRVYQYGVKLKKSWRGRIEYLIILFFSIFGKRIKFLRSMLLWIEAKYFPGEMYDHYFEEMKPSLLVTSSVGYMIDPFFMRSAKRMGCKVVSIPHSWDNPTTKDYRGASPDYVLTWNQIMKNELELFHDIPGEKIYPAGIGHWDFYFEKDRKEKLEKREEFFKRQLLDPQKKLIFYGTSNHKIFRNTFSILRQILEAIQSGKINEDAQLLVRLHPAYLLKQPKGEGQILENYQEEMDRLMEDFPGKIVFSPPQMIFLKEGIDMPRSDMFELAACLEHADLLLTEFSTLMIEGAIFNLPIINVGLDRYRDTEKGADFLENFTHIKRILKVGATPTAYHFDTLVSLVNEHLASPEKLVQERKDLVKQEVTHNPGQAAEAIADYLAQWAGES